MPESLSEKNGLQLVEPSFREILSIGISTAGIAEIKMAALAPNSHIVATTLDSEGVEHVREKIAKLGLSERIEVRVENIAHKLSVRTGVLFDFVYARLVLHYLSAQDLADALTNIHRSMNPYARLYVVVRSENSPEAKQASNTYDPVTRLTTYEVASKEEYATRYFHSQKSISDSILSAGFSIESICEYDESLSPNFDRSGTPVPNKVIEVQARRT